MSYEFAGVGLSESVANPKFLMELLTPCCSLLRIAPPDGQWAVGFYIPDSAIPSSSSKPSLSCISCIGGSFSRPSRTAKRHWKGSKVRFTITVHVVKTIYSDICSTKTCTVELQYSCTTAKWNIGSKWNPITFKPKDPLCLPRYHLSGLIQQIEQ